MQRFPWLLSDNRKMQDTIFDSAFRRFAFNRVLATLNQALEGKVDEELIGRLKIYYKAKIDDGSRDEVKSLVKSLPELEKLWGDKDKLALIDKLLRAKDSQNAENEQSEDEAPPREAEVVAKKVPEKKVVEKAKKEPKREPVAEVQKPAPELNQRRRIDLSKISEDRPIVGEPRTPQEEEQMAGYYMKKIERILSLQLDENVYKDVLENAQVIYGIRGYKGVERYFVDINDKIHTYVLDQRPNKTIADLLLKLETVNENHNNILARIPGSEKLVIALREEPNKKQAIAQLSEKSPKS